METSAPAGPSWCSLWINGYAHDFTADEGFDFVIGVAEGVIDLDESERRLAAHRVKRP
ncbi:hypothetical protein [Cryobacterium sp. Y62]|uniref:hypothetical protein n=1 Tax=unclassified Cryobacterium TaxID=2649013 RepID=UPI0034CF9DBB